MFKIKNIILSFVTILIVTFSLNVNAATTIKENSDDFTGDVYVIGGTKFDNNYTITASRAARAGANQVLLELQFGSFNNGNEIEIKTYYYSNLTKKWYVIPEEGGKVQNVTTTENEYLENELEIFYINNEVKLLEYTPNFSVSGNLHEEYDVKYENGVFKIPATVTYFEFETTNNKKVFMDTTYDDEEEMFSFGDFYVAEINSVVKAYDFNDKDNLSSAKYRNEFYIGEDGHLRIDNPDELYYSEDNYAVIEYVDKDGNPIDMLNSTFTEGDVVYQKLGKAAFVTNGVNHVAADLEQFLDRGYSLITLLDNVEISEPIVLENPNTNMNLDLNGKTLSCSGDCTRIIRANGKNSSLSITNGTIEAGDAQGITVGQKTEEIQNVWVNVKDDVTINANTYGITVFGNKAKLDFSGTINIKNDGYGISGNGSSGYAGTEITINDGAKITATHENGFALYLPQKGNVQINGGELTGASVIGIKAGNLNIYGGTLTATGNKVIPIFPTNDGTESTGDVIFVEMNDKYVNNDLNITINNANLSSKNSGNILVYNSNSENTPIINYFGNTTIEKTYDVNGKAYTRYLADSEAVMAVNEKNYSINSYMNELDSNSEFLSVKLLKDIVLTKDIIFDTDNQTINFDLNGKTLSCNGDCTRIIRANGKNSSLFITNGTIEAGDAQGITVGQKTEEEQNVFVNVANDVTINADTYGITVFGNKANLDFSGTINIKNDGYGISGNGSSGYAGTEITINDGAKITATHKDGFALYIPQNGIVNIYNGELKGASVVGIKSGTLNVLGGKLIATGEKINPVYPTNNGTESTGDVIFVEMNDKYAKNVEVNVSSEATLSTTDENAKAIFVYNSNSIDAPIIRSDEYSTVETSLDTNGKLYTYYLPTSEAVMTVNEKNYSINSYMNELNSNSEFLSVKLLKDIVLTKDIIFGTDNQTINFDLNGKTLSCNGDCTRIIRANGKNSSLSITNGTIEAGDAQGITVGQKNEEEQNVFVNVANDVTINADTYGITVFGNKAKLDFFGTINIKNDGYGISGNGSAGYAGTEITINDGAKITATHKDGFALYIPQQGTTNINGGLLKGASVVGIKSGILNILGGELIATGEKINPVYPTNNGTESTGDVIFVEMNDKYAKNVEVNVSSEATLSTTDENAKAIFVYNSNSDDRPTINAEKYSTIETSSDTNGKLYTFYSE